MTCPSLGVRAPADAYSSNWRTSYLYRTIRSIKKAFLHGTRVLFGCNHRNLTEVDANDRQYCTDCLAWRYVLSASELYPAYTSRWHVAEKKAGEFAAVGDQKAAVACPPALHRLPGREARDAAFIQLLFAAKRLAARRISMGALAPPAGIAGHYCRECGATAAATDQINHTAICDAGVIFSAIAELENLVHQSPNRKERAREEEIGRAGHGMRPRGFHRGGAA